MGHAPGRRARGCVGHRGRAPDLVRERLARHKVPRDVVFLDTLARNAAGKVLERRLPDDDA